MSEKIVAGNLDEVISKNAEIRDEMREKAVLIRTNLNRMQISSSNRLAMQILKPYGLIQMPIDNAVWMNRMYQEWPLRGTTTRSGREKKKNAGEISLTILAEVFSWYYPDSESITVYTQDRDSYDYQKSARERLNDVFASKTSIDVSYKSNDTLLCQMFRNGMLSLGQIDTLRCDERVVVYTRSRDDKSTALVAKRTDNQQFKALLQDMNVQIIF